MKFYPTDWRADPRLRMCSLAARGLWIDLISYMHEGEPYGYLTINGAAIERVDDIAALVGRPVAEVRKALAELEARQVFRRDGLQGTIISRRMVRDHDRSEEGRKQISKRWNNSPPNREPNRGATKEPITQKPEARKDDGGGDARETPLVSPEAISLADEVMTVLGIDLEFIPPGWCGAAMRLHAGLASGWHRDIVLMAVRKVAARPRAGPIDNFAYLEKPIAREHALAAQPIPVAAIQPQETRHVHATTRSPDNLDAATARVRASLRRSLDPDAAGEGAEGGLRGDSSVLDAEALSGGGYRVL
jgi:hypothetical protein